MKRETYCFEITHLDPKYDPPKYVIRAKSEAAVRKRISDPDNCIIKKVDNCQIPRTRYNRSKR